MIRVMRAELALLSRRWVLIASGGIVIAFATIASLAVMLSTQPAALTAPGRGTTIESLQSPGGATEAFRVSTGFIGVLVLVTFAARMAGEFSHGTLRMLLVREPRRARVAVGKVAAMIAFAAGALAVAAVLTVVLSRALAPSQDIATGAWFGLDGLRAAVGDYLSAVAGLTTWALYGTLLALLLRSVPVAVAVGVAWAGPFEHLLQQAWSTATRFLPGLQVEALAAGGTIDITYQRALGLSLAYGSVAVAVGLLSLARRDITG